MMRVWQLEQIQSNLHQQTISQFKSHLQVTQIHFRSEGTWESVPHCQHDSHREGGEIRGHIIQEKFWHHLPGISWLQCMLNQKPTIPTTFRRMEREREERDANFRVEPTFFQLGDTHRRSILLCRFKRRTDHLHVNHPFNLGVILRWCHTIVPAISDWGIKRTNHSRRFMHMLFRFAQPGN